tara:strand:- start:129 stop:674 length:546 start_codon:yes stop_codon:yes gene_type:complete
MIGEEIQELLKKYAEIVVSEAKENLISKGRAGALSESISYQLETEADAFLLDFLMEDYGPFIDEGVQGSNPSGIYKNNPDKNGVQKAPLSQFKYTSKMPPMQPLASWAKKKNIRFRNKLGQYARGSNIQMGFALQRSIFFQGITPTYFFSKPYNANLDMLDKGILEAFALDIEKAIILGTK